MKTKTNYSECSIFVLGINMSCPLCGELVESGYRHRCEAPEPVKAKKPKPNGKKAGPR